MARPSVELHSDAIAEARAAYLWYAECNLVAGDAFIAALDQAINQILDRPERWPLHEHATRKYLLRRFPYSVIYRVTQTASRLLLSRMAAGVLGIREAGGFEANKTNQDLS